MARARAESAELALIDRRIEEQRARVALANALRSPDLTPEGSLTRGFGDDAEFQTGWKAALAVSIPLFTTHKAGVALEEADPCATGRGARRCRNAHRRRDRRRDRDRRRVAATVRAVSRPDPAAGDPGGNHGGRRVSTRANGHRGVPAGVAVHARRPPARPAGGNGIGRAHSPISNGRWERRFNHESPNRLLILVARLRRRVQSSGRRRSRKRNHRPCHDRSRRQPATSARPSRSPGPSPPRPTPTRWSLRRRPRALPSSREAEGDRVRKGDLLVRFEIPELVADVATQARRSDARPGPVEKCARGPDARARFVRTRRGGSQGSGRCRPRARGCAGRHHRGGGDVGRLRVVGGAIDGAGAFRRGRGQAIS